MDFNPIKPFEHQNLFGGAGRLGVWDLLKTQAARSFTAALRCELDPAASVDRHKQEHFPEIMICLSGQGLVEINGISQLFHAGSVAHLPSGAVLAIQNRAPDVALTYLVVKAAA